MIVSISWNNIWRNKQRSMVVIIAITLGTVAGVFVAGLMNGWVTQRIHDVVFLETGHIKIQNPDYLVNEEIKHSVKDYELIVRQLDTMPEVKSWSARSKVMAMASTARGSVGITLKGIDPEKEKQVSGLYEKLLPNSGTYFESKSRLPQVLISRKTAEMLKIRNYRVTEKVIDSLNLLGVPESTFAKLDILTGKRYITQKKFEQAVSEIWSANEIRKFAPVLADVASYIRSGSKITFSFTKADGEIGYQSYRVCGVYKTSNSLFDQMSAFVNHADLVAGTGISENSFHEVSIVINSEDRVEQVSNDLNVLFENSSVMSWKKLQPDVGMMSDFMGVYYYIVMGIIFLALAFGIINTMLMAILERIKELGMLMAIGMKKIKVFFMIMLETIFLTLTGSVAGMIIGAVIIKITGMRGINFSGVEEGFESFGWSANVYPDIEISFFFGIIVMVIVISILSAIIPAQKALKLKPVEALRIE